MPNRVEPGDDHPRGAIDLFIGLMSGTSMDGVDAAVVEFGSHSCKVHASASTPYPDELRGQLLQLSRDPTRCTLDDLGALDQRIGECFRDAARGILERAAVPSTAVTAIGSHGQTIRHQPRALRPFTLQIGDPNIIAAGTGITTVADFRRRDIALGGEGAPLAPAFHQWLFGHEGRRAAVVNIGGIANVTVLNGATDQVIGFDTGPGNTLLDGWIRDKKQRPFDDCGMWAATGQVREHLLARLLDDPFFSLEPPKSTGFEYFSAAWVADALSSREHGAVEDADVQATLAELSAITISRAVSRYGGDVSQLIICGGGVHNADLMSRLRRLLPAVSVVSSAKFGLDPDNVEAAAFAWLAKRCLERQPGNLPSVTGASHASILGAIYPCID